MRHAHTPWPASHSSSLEDDIGEHLEVLRQLRDLREGQTETNNRLNVMSDALERVVNSRSVDSLRVDWLVRSFKLLAERLGTKLPDEKDG